ncbi:hypothetical protein [Paludibaculum fermentans]|uniref:hypothetical protein n=1 Tax=Paludibaculum fermentans TaxID=1473598 RepID=UPI003EB972C5
MKGVKPGTQSLGLLSSLPMRSKFILCLSLLSLSLLAQVPQKAQAPAATAQPAQPKSEPAPAVIKPQAATVQPCIVNVQPPTGLNLSWLSPILSALIASGVTLLGIYLNNRHNEKLSINNELRNLRIKAYDDCISLLVELRSLSLSVKERHTALKANPTAENRIAFNSSDVDMTNAILRLLKALNLLTLSRSTAGEQALREYGGKLARRVNWEADTEYEAYLSDLSTCQMELTKAGAADIWSEQS